MLVRERVLLWYMEDRTEMEKMHILLCYPSQDSSVGSISAWYRGGPGFKSRQGREFFNENK